MVDIIDFLHTKSPSPFLHQTQADSLLTFDWSNSTDSPPRQSCRILLNLRNVTHTTVPQATETQNAYRLRSRGYCNTTGRHQGMPSRIFCLVLATAPPIPRGLSHVGNYTMDLKVWESSIADLSRERELPRHVHRTRTRELLIATLEVRRALL